MSEEEYQKKYGKEYNAGQFWDYPVSELNYIADGLRNGDRDINTFALINDRLYEVPLQK